MVGPLVDGLLFFWRGGRVGFKNFYVQTLWLLSWLTKIGLFGNAWFLACGFRADSRAWLWVLTSFVPSPLKIPVYHESKLQNVCCLFHARNVCDGTERFNTETTRLSPTPGFGPLTSSLWSRPDLLLLVTCLFLVYAGVKSSYSSMTPEEKHIMRYVCY